MATGVKVECGPALLDKRLTGWRGEHEWLAAGSSVAAQQTIRDFGRARAKALKDRKDKKLPVRARRGMPKFKSKHRAAPSLNYTLRGFVLDGPQVRLAGGIVVRPVWSRELPGAPSSVRVYRDPLGRWWCSFVVPRPETESLPAIGRSIGIDWGVTEMATTTSDAHDLAHPQHGDASRARLTRYQRMMARRKPIKGSVASRGYKAAKRGAAKQHATSRPNAPTPAANGPRPWCVISIRSPSRTSGPSFWRSRRWRAKPPMAQSPPPSAH